MSRNLIRPPNTRGPRCGGGLALTLLCLSAGAVAAPFELKLAKPGLAVASSASTAPPTPTLGPVVAQSTSALEFGTVKAGTSLSLSVTLTNPGPAEVTVSSLVSDSAVFHVEGGCGGTLQPAASCTAVIRFAPSSIGPQQGLLTFEIGADAVTQSVSLAGTGSSSIGAGDLLRVNADGSWADASGHAAAAANVTVSATAKVGSGSLSFAGTGSSLRYAATAEETAFGTGDFTASAWVLLKSYTSNGTNGRQVFDFRPTGANGVYPALALGPTGLAQYFTASTIVLQAGQPVPLNTWTHLAISRKDGLSRLFINGKRVAQAEDTRNYLGSTAVRIGTNAFEATAPHTAMHGLIDQVLITRGVALHIEDFTP